MDKERDYWSEIQVAFCEFFIKTRACEIIIVPMDFYNGLILQLFKKNTKHCTPKIFGRKIIGSPHTDKIEFR